MIRYSDYTQLEYKGLKVSSLGMVTITYERLLEVSFVGMEFEDHDKQVPQTATITVRLSQRQKNENLFIPFEERWTKDFADVLVPTGVWNGMKLGQLTEDKMFVAIGTSVAELDLQNGNVLWIKEYANTPINKIGLTSSKDLLVLYSSYKFKSKMTKSNFIKIDDQSSLLWSAKTKNKNDAFVYFRYIDNELYGSTWDGWSIKLDETNGNIIDAHWSK